MGTNYYFYENSPCEKCGRSDEARHIGKSSAGWVFALHVYPEDGINTLDDWGIRFTKAAAIIRDEYGRDVGQSDMWTIITGRKWKDRDQSEQWYRENHAEAGPHGLARTSVDGRYCVGHGEGTWDYHIGDFS